MAAEILCKVKSNFWNHQIFVQLFTSFSFSPQTFYRLICWESLFPESECKGIAFFLNLQIFQQLFSIKISHFRPLQLHHIVAQAITHLHFFLAFRLKIPSLQNQSPKLPTYNDDTHGSYLRYTALHISKKSQDFTYRNPAKQIIVIS